MRAISPAVAVAVAVAEPICPPEVPRAADDLDRIAALIAKAKQEGR